MSALQIITILGAGLVAGAVNAVVGSGSLLTFPALLAAGYSPLVANISNSVGLVLGNVSGVVGYRRELAGQERRAAALAIPAAIGSLVGAILLLALPESVFHRVVPALVLLSVVLVVVQPRLSERLARYRDRPASSWALRVGVALTAVYGGYFGAAMGVLLIGVLSVFLKDDLQRINALKNVMSTVINFVAAIVFVFAAHVAWIAAALIAVSSIAGGFLGAAIGRRLHPNVLRALVVVAGLVAFVKLLA
ncbi:MAG TPA: sulfite exporter TauE/SafE family protein [Candidatus Dormibacteraeota bacterium]|nr:sulfite exporter TauE/SafE family protein [Candidatus Dormibacteraeota bacterium]